ncbi:unnamed protein product [Ranitomeya imitator]|uniref:Uncharacterized protein n=1 Tax=Ranitomeya imitator TaxID=111125 RepID=A0ABN9MKN4_9NEOB|nr:unnamed protein product [Ranitomeya imitator]
MLRKKTRGNTADYFLQHVNSLCGFRCGFTPAPIENCRVPVRRASASRTDNVFNVFDRSMKRRQKNWAASQGNAHQYEYLREEIAERVADRVFDVARTFPFALDIGCGRGYISRHLTKVRLRAHGFCHRYVLCCGQSV